MLHFLHDFISYIINLVFLFSGGFFFAVIHFAPVPFFEAPAFRRESVNLEEVLGLLLVGRARLGLGKGGGELDYQRMHGMLILATRGHAKSLEIQHQTQR